MEGVILHLNKVLKLNMDPAKYTQNTLGQGGSTDMARHGTPS